MATTICTRCSAISIRTAIRAARSDTRHSIRAFSNTPPRSKKHHGLPRFHQDTSPELLELLTTIKDKHFLPAYLGKSERKLIFGTKYRQQLADNPTKVQIGDDEVQLQWIDRRTEIPNRTTLYNRIIDLMSQGSAKDWENLPRLLEGLKHTRATPGRTQLAKLVRRAANAGRLGIILECLRQSERTGLTLTRPGVLENVIWALHEQAQRSGWEEEAVIRSLKGANEIALLLETEEHGSGRFVAKDDARRRPEVIAVVLELAAVYAFKYRGGKDMDGKVKAYAERLLSCIGENFQPTSLSPSPTGQHLDMLHGVLIWHGLFLAEKILGSDMPKPEQAKAIRHDYEAGLTMLAQTIEAQNPKEGSYGDQALRAWRECIRD